MEQICCGMKNSNNKTSTFDTKRSIEKAPAVSESIFTYQLNKGSKMYQWHNRLDRVNAIRAGIPYDAIEMIGNRLSITVKSVLALLGIPQTTYNKKKSEHSLLDSRDSELIISIDELLCFGMEVFNNEENKFQRWLKKPNVSIGGHTPESMLDTIAGINEVKYSLNRLEYGNLA